MGEGVGVAIGVAGFDLVSVGCPLVPGSSCPNYSVAPDPPVLAAGFLLLTAALALDLRERVARIAE